MRGSCRTPADSCAHGGRSGKSPRPPRSPRTDRKQPTDGARGARRLIREMGRYFLLCYRPGRREPGPETREDRGGAAGTRAPPPAPAGRSGPAGLRAPGSARRSPVAGTRCTNFPPRAHHSGGASSRSPGGAPVPPHPSPRALALSPRRGSGRRARGRAGRARPYLFQVALAQARRCCVPRSSAEAAAGSLLPRSLRLGELMNFNLRRVLMVTPAARAAPTRARRRALRHAPRCAPGPGRRRAAPSTRKLGSEQEAQRPRGVPPRPRASAPGPQPAGPPG